MKADDLYTKVTNDLIAAIEAGAGTWEMPWKRIAAGGVPMSVSTGKHYNGINWWLLGLQQQDRGYRGRWWATYNQWQSRDCQVRKGQSGPDHGATEIFIWKPSKRKVETPSGDTEMKDSLFASTFKVFNVDQVDGAFADTLRPADVPLTEHDRHEAAETFFSTIGADVRGGGDQAFYASVGDYIGMPLIEQFPVRDHYYSTLAHEHTHWTGHESRLNRDLRNRFGSEAYAAEELIAEIGAAFIAAQLDLEPAVRQDHAPYLSHWLSILKGDRRAITTAASAAQKAVDHLNKLANVEQKEMQPA